MADFLTVNPTFKIVSWEKAEPILLQFVEGTKSHEGCLYYGWIVHTDADGNKTVEAREAWADAASLIEHTEGDQGVSSILSTFVSPDIAVLESIYLTGPASELPAAMKVFGPLGAIAYETMPGAFNNIKTFTGPVISPQTHITVHPTFTIKDWAKAQLILDQCQTATKEHEGNIYYGFVKREDSVKCREAWADSTSLKEHIEGGKGIGAVMGALVEPNVGSLDSIYVAAPPDQLEAAWKIFEGFGATKFEVHSGISRFQMS